MTSWKARSMIQAWKGLPKSVYILFIATIINRLGGFVHVFLTILLKTRLGFSDAAIANYVILAGLSTALSPLLGGVLADRFHRKWTMLLSSGMGALVYLFAGFLAGRNQLSLLPWLLIAASFFFSISSPVINAMVADLTETSDMRRRSYSLIYLGINLGVAIGPVIGGQLLH